MDSLRNLVEAVLHISPSAKEEAEELSIGGIPENFSIDKELENFVRKSKQSGHTDMQEFISLDTFKSTNQLERCQAVLVAILFMK